MDNSVYLIIAGGVLLFLVFAYWQKKQKEQEQAPKVDVMPKEDTMSIVKSIRDMAKVVKDSAKPQIEKPYRKYRLLINSDERDDSRYPNVNNYQLNIPDHLYGVQKIQLMKASFPTSLELINNNNNELRFNINSTDYTAAITNGYYNGTELATAIQTAMNAAGSGETFVVTFSTSTGFMTINCSSSVNTFDISNTGSYLLDLIGMTTFVSTGGSPNTLTSTRPVNVAYPQNILLELSDDAYDFNSLRIMDKSDNDRRCFAYLTFPSGNGGLSGTASPATVTGSRILVEGSGGNNGFGLYVVTKDTTNAYYKFYEGSISRMRLLNIRLRQLLPDGTIVDPDFNGANHSIELEVTARVDKTSLSYT
jgi:hypothetical protein